jgi:hypothetical protein
MASARNQRGDRDSGRNLVLHQIHQIQRLCAFREMFQEPPRPVGKVARPAEHVRNQIGFHQQDQAVRGQSARWKPAASVEGKRPSKIDRSAPSSPGGNGSTSGSSS